MLLREHSVSTDMGSLDWKDPAGAHLVAERAPLQDHAAHEGTPTKLHCPTNSSTHFQFCM
jgi:hypothetical protein